MVVKCKGTRGELVLALRGYESQLGVLTSVSWLATWLAACSSPYSLAWGILALAAYRKKSIESDKALPRAAEALAVAIGKGAATLDTSTLATCALALEALEGANVFEVRE